MGTLEGVRKFFLDDGRPGLRLILEGGLPLAVLIDPNSMPVLRNELRELEELSKKPNPGKSH